MLRAEVRELRVRLDRFEAWQQTVVAHALAVSSRLDTPDASARLLSAIARAYGGRVFTAADLSSSMDEELRAVLVGMAVAWAPGCGACTSARSRRIRCGVSVVTVPASCGR